MSGIARHSLGDVVPGVENTDGGPERFSLRVRAVVPETEAASSIELAVPDHLTEAFTYRPGQFLTLRVPSNETGSVARSYSLSSAPGIDEHLTVTVKRTRAGYGSNWLCDNVRPGDELTVLPPSGRFTPHSLDNDLLLFAAGSGITPMMSILKAAMVDGKADVALFYASTRSADMIFDEALRDLEKKYTPRLRIQRWLDAEQGLPNSVTVATLAADMPTADVFLCGPAPFMNMVTTTLAEAGVDHARVHREVFTSLSGNPFEFSDDSVDGDAGVGEAGSADESSAVIHLNGERLEIGWRRSRNLVDELVARDKQVPHSCRSGECGSCICIVLSGSVEMENFDILDPEDLADGYVLGCQARPISEHVEVKFE